MFVGGVWKIRQKNSLAGSAQFVGGTKFFSSVGSKMFVVGARKIRRRGFEKVSKRFVGGIRGIRRRGPGQWSAESAKLGS